MKRPDGEKQKAEIAAKIEEGLASLRVGRAIPAEKGWAKLRTRRAAALEKMSAKRK